MSELWANIRNKIFCSLLYLNDHYTHPYVFLVIIVKNEKYWSLKQDLLFISQIIIGNTGLHKHSFDKS